MKAIIRVEAQVPVKVFQEDDVYVAHCPVFDVSSQGCTRDEAKKNMVEAITGFLVTCYEMGTLDEVLKECGFRPSESPVNIDSCEQDVDILDIPLPFMLNDTTPLSECLA